MCEADTEILCRPENLCAIRRGSIVYALPVPYTMRKLEYVRDGVERKAPYWDWELIPAGKWAYALTSRELTYPEHPIDDVPFSSERPPVSLLATGTEIDWRYEDGYEIVCARAPQSSEPISPPTALTLVPYACAKLRITKLPIQSQRQSG